VDETSWKWDYWKVSGLNEFWFIGEEKVKAGMPYVDLE